MFCLHRCHEKHTSSQLDCGPIPTVLGRSELLSRILIFILREYVWYIFLDNLLGNTDIREQLHTAYINNIRACSRNSVLVDIRLGPTYTLYVYVSLFFSSRYNGNPISEALAVYGATNQLVRNQIKETKNSNCLTVDGTSILNVDCGTGIVSKSSLIINIKDIILSE